MNFKAEREARGWTLQEVASQAGYSVAAVNGLELRNEGGYKLRVKLNQLFGNNNPVPFDQLQDRNPPALRAAAPESEAEIWKRRAKAAEKELHDLKTKMRELLK